MKRSERKKVKTEGDKGHPDPHHSETPDHTCHVEGSIKVSGVIETNRPPDLTQEHKTERKEDAARDDKKYIVELLTLGIVTIYAFLTAMQACFIYQGNKTNREALTSVQRAFVSFKGMQGQRRIYKESIEMTFNGKPVKNEPIPVWDIYGVLENSGTTPAEHVITQADAKVRDGEPPVNAFAENPNETPTATTLGPKATTLLSFGWHPFADQQLFGEKINEEYVGNTLVNGKFYVWGWIIYHDVFKQTDLHVTEFCQHLTGVRKPEGGGYDLIFANCTNHNCTDRDCADYDYVMKTLIRWPR